MQKVNKKVVGAYVPLLVLEDGTTMSAVEYIAGLADNMLDANSINPMLLGTRYNPVLSSQLTHSGEGWFSDTPTVATGIRSIYVPTLSEMGLADTLYELEAQTQLYAADANDTENPVDTRLIEVPTLAVVSGSDGSGVLPGSAAGEVVFKSDDFFTVEGGKHYAVDFKQTHINATFLFSVGRFALLIRVKKK